MEYVAVTVLLSILNQMEFNLVQNRDENYRIPFNLKEIGYLFLTVWVTGPLLPGGKKLTLSVREAHIFWHHVAPNEVPPYAPHDHTVMMFERFQGDLNSSPMMPRDVSLSDSRTPDPCRNRSPTLLEHS